MDKYPQVQHCVVCDQDYLDYGYDAALLKDRDTHGCRICGAIVTIPPPVVERQHKQ